jgi:DNA-binding NarL/FixJ family response regulator
VIGSPPYLFALLKSGVDRTVSAEPTSPSSRGPGGLELLTGTQPGAPISMQAARYQASRRRLASGNPSRAGIRVLVAAGQAVLRAGYRALLESEDTISVVAEAATGEEAIEIAAQTAPTVALVDQGLPGLEDPEGTAAVVSGLVAADVAVMLMALSANDERVESALRAGAVGVLQKDDQPAAFIGAIKLVARGQALLPAPSVRRLLGDRDGQLCNQFVTDPDIAELTDREREVVALAATGLTNGEIASRLVISPATAKTHVSRAMTKLHARHRAQLVVAAYEHGLVLSQQELDLNSERDREMPQRLKASSEWRSDDC